MTNQLVQRDGKTSVTNNPGKIRLTICRAFTLGLLTVMLMLPSCGTVGSTDNVTGTWDSIITATGGTQAPVGTRASVVFTLTQVDTTVTGTFVTQGGASGQLNGQFDGTEFTFSISQQIPCSGSFNGTARIAAFTGQLIGSYSGLDCNGTLDADFAGSRR